MMQPLPEFDGALVADSLAAGARTAQRTGLAVAVVVSRDPGVVAQARLAADALGDIDVETTITATSIKVCFRPRPPAARPEPKTVGTSLAELWQIISVRRKRSRD